MNCKLIVLSLFFTSLIYTESLSTEKVNISLSNITTYLNSLSRSLPNINYNTRGKTVPDQYTIYNSSSFDKSLFLIESQIEWAFFPCLNISSNQSDWHSCVIVVHIITNLLQETDELFKNKIAADRTIKCALVFPIFMNEIEQFNSRLEWFNYCVPIECLTINNFEHFICQSSFMMNAELHQKNYDITFYSRLRAFLYAILTLLSLTVLLFYS